MKKELVVCDRCGAEIKNKEEVVVATDCKEGIFLKLFDICRNCNEDFERFMERRSLLDVINKRRRDLR